MNPSQALQEAKTFRKKQVIVEAIQYNNLNKEQIEKFVGKKLHQELESETAYLAGKGAPIFSISIETKEGIMKAFPSDWIIKEPFPTGDRDFYPCKNDIFIKTYEATASSSSGERGDGEEIVTKEDILLRIKKLGTVYNHDTLCDSIWKSFCLPHPSTKAFSREYSDLLRRIEIRKNPEKYILNYGFEKFLREKKKHVIDIGSKHSLDTYWYRDIHEAVDEYLLSILTLSSHTEVKEMELKLEESRIYKCPSKFCSYKSKVFKYCPIHKDQRLV